MRSPFLFSVLFHVGVCLAMVGYGWWMVHTKTDWGDLNPSGGSIGITPVSSISLPSNQGRTNPVANDTESLVPQKPVEQKTKAAKEDDADAIPLKSKRQPKTRAEVAASLQKYRPSHPQHPNQVYSTTGQALQSPMFGGQAGSGGVGIGNGNPFGTRCGGYLATLRQTVANNWKYGDVDPNLRTAPDVVVRFELQQNGSIRDVSLVMRSGNYALDTSAQRAIIQSAPFPPIQPECGRQSASLEFHFQLRR